MGVGIDFLAFRCNKFCTIPLYVDSFYLAVTDLREQTRFYGSSATALTCRLKIDDRNQGC